MSNYKLKEIVIFNNSRLTYINPHAFNEIPEIEIITIMENCLLNNEKQFWDIIWPGKITIYLRIHCKTH
jgi:hypothetical protein